jgi:hypothetical protein
VYQPNQGFSQGLFYAVDRTSFTIQLFRRDP